MTLAFSLLDVLTASRGGEETGGRRGGSSADEIAARRVAEEKEQALIASVRAGDPAAFRILMDAHFARAAQFAYTFIRERDAAEDIAQDVFARIWAGHSEWAPHTSVRAYVLGAVRNRALDAVKHRGVEARYVDAVHEPGAGVDAVGSARLEWVSELRTLQAAVAELPERRRMALSLRYEHELSHAEVGATLGVSAKAAKELIVRTLDALRARLSQGR